MTDITPFVARHPGGLSPSIAALARERLPLLADAMERFLAHIASGRGGDGPLDEEGIRLTVTRSIRADASGGLFSIRMHQNGRSVCGIDADAADLDRSSDLFGTASRTIAITRMAIESAAAHDGPPSDVRNRLFDHPADLVAAWRAVGTLARGEMVRVGGMPFDRTIVRANVIGETPLSPFSIHFDLKRSATADADVHHVDPTLLKRLRLPGAVDVSTSMPNGCLLISLTPHLEEVVSDTSDTMVLMRAEADLAAFRSMNP